MQVCGKAHQQTQHRLTDYAYEVDRFWTKTVREGSPSGSGERETQACPAHYGPDPEQGVPRTVRAYTGNIEGQKNVDEIERECCPEL